MITAVACFGVIIILALVGLVLPNLSVIMADKKKKRKKKSRRKKNL